MMLKNKTILSSAFVGGLLGYVLLSPVAMVISDQVHRHLEEDYLAQMNNSLWVSLTESFSPKFFIWAASHTAMGILLGLIVGILLYKVMNKQTLLAEEMTKRMDSFQTFQSEYEEWKSLISGLKAEVNELLEKLGQPKKY